jgi:hypothetical protein
VPGARSPSLTVSAIATATSTALDAASELPFQPPLADGPEHDSEHPSPEVLALANHNDVHLGRPVGLPREGVRELPDQVMGLVRHGSPTIPNSNIIYAVAGLAIFGAFTIFDTTRLRRASDDGAVVIAASIFLDIFNVFLLLLNLFGGRDDQPAVR